jgi:Domain of unknown function (DUF929)
MVGSGPDDGDILELGPQKPPRRWAIGRRSRLALAVAGACALLAVGGTVAGIRLSSHGPADPALTRLITEVTTVPASAAGSRSGSLGLYVGALQGTTVSVNAATGSVVLDDGFPSPTGPNGRPLTSNGKPEVLYVATEYCPYCVAQSWPLIVALSRFGEFSGLSTSRSPAFEGNPPVDGWTFYGSSYKSRYLAFVPVETYSNVLVNGKADPGNPLSYRTLQRLTPAEQAVLSEFDRGRRTPFADFGGAATALGSDVMPTTLAGLTWSEIAADLRRPGSAAGATILFSANVLTYQLCQLTGDRPAAACPKS